MGDDGETFSSNSKKPSFGDEEAAASDTLNSEQQCEFVPKSSFDLKEREELAESVTPEVAVQGEVEETKDMHAANGVEDKTGAEELVGGGGSDGEVLTEMVIGENSEFREEGHIEEQAVGAVVVAEEVEEALIDSVEFKEDATAGDTEENDSDMGGVVGKSEYAVVDEAVAFIGGDKLITESDNLQSTADGSVTVEEETKVVVTAVESSLVMGAQKELEAAVGKEINVEGNLTAEVKLEEEASIEINEKNNAESVAGLQGLQFVGHESPNLAKEDMNQLGGIIDNEGPVTDTEMDDIKGTEELENSVSNDVPYDGQESVFVFSDEAKEERLPEEICIADTVLKEGKEAETEVIKIGGVESICKPADTDIVHQNDEIEEIIAEGETAVSDTGMETETDAQDELRLLGSEVGAEAETVEVGDVKSTLNTDNAKLVFHDGEDEEIVANKEPALVGSAIEIKMAFGENPRVLGLEQGKEAETETFEVHDVDSVPKIDNAKPDSQDEENGKVGAVKESALAGLEVETRTDVGEEQRLLGTEKQKVAYTETLEVHDVEFITKIDDAKPISHDEEDGDTSAEEESALAGMEIDTQTDVGEEQRALRIDKWKEAETETVEGDDIEYIPGTDDAKHVLQDNGDEEMVAEEESALGDTEMETETDVGESSRAVGEKHKRGKNSKTLTKSKTLSKAQKIMEEDVCFICFDGGDLVLCDRR